MKAAMVVSGKRVARATKKPINKARLRDLAKRGLLKPQVISSDDVRELAQGLLQILGDETKD